MTSDQEELIEKAQRSVAAAGILLEEGYPGFAVSRAYYAMFYIAEAFLEGEGLAFSKHSATIAAFGKQFIKTGQIPKEFHRYLIEAMEARHEGDYVSREVIAEDRAKQIVGHAEEFIGLARQMMAGNADGQKNRTSGESSG